MACHNGAVIMLESSLIARGFRLQDWIVEPRLGRIVRGQVVVRLRPRVMELLVLLAERAGDVVGKRDIVDAVWSSGFVADNTVVHCVNELREALGDATDAPRYVQTIPRRGYRLICRVQPCTEGESPKEVDGARYELVATGWSAYLVEGENLLGRGGEARIVIESSRVSRHHARILVSPDGAVIEDLGSKNGTFVGDRKIAEPTPLADGEEVRLGDFCLEFRGRAPDGVDATVTME
jgi:DNA-binding winged helix-turn-helix (wHTH) protein